MGTHEGGSDLDPAAIPADSKYVCIDRSDETDYWRSHFGASRDELEQAVEAVGHGYAAVAAYLNQDRNNH
ncbi:DUF3606 domain-containing protein [Sphingomonas bisphenolicum]|jgi:hypothetical protein|uniref:DUF3606 domain-containing protein n=1 Tax=Sphingomonas bisphenolicum TaxID=296544 RepID=A0ABN5WM72_9SPHN|nr:DUF3606 domain-containing protein [Sphingomonas bisphenolicum]BBF70681.1 hypothetical protein SBA_ch1_28810 [Sphingomonas bisphenolicum]